MSMCCYSIIAMSYTIIIIDMKKVILFIKHKEISYVRTSAAAWNSPVRLSLLVLAQVHAWLHVYVCHMYTLVVLYSLHWSLFLTYMHIRRTRIRVEPLLARRRSLCLHWWSCQLQERNLQYTQIKNQVEMRNLHMYHTTLRETAYSTFVPGASGPPLGADITGL